MNTDEAVASEVAAPAASEATAPTAGQESVGVGPAGPGGLPVATPAGSAAAGVQLGTVPEKLVECRRGCIPPGGSAVAGSRTKYPVLALWRLHPVESNPVTSRRG